MRSRRVAALLLVLSLVAAACGSDVEVGTTSSTSTPEANTSSTAPTTSVAPDPSIQEVRLDLPRAEVDPGIDAIAEVVAGDVTLGLDLDTDADVTGLPEFEVEIDPWVFMLSVGKKF